MHALILYLCQLVSFLLHQTREMYNSYVSCDCTAVVIGLISTCDQCMDGPY